MSLEQDVRAVVSEALGSTATVDRVTVTPAGKRRVARVVVERPLADPVGDRPVEPLTLDEIADATRVVSDALDGSDVMGSQPYTLEVTTPGTDRPLTEPIHFRRNVGRLVAVTDADGSTTTGRVLATTADGLELEIPPTKKQPARTERRAYADITSALVQVEFNRPQPEAPGDADDKES